jgi:hypothetical protein
MEYLKGLENIPWSTRVITFFVMSSFGDSHVLLAAIQLVSMRLYERATKTMALERKAHNCGLSLGEIFEGHVLS